MEVDDEEFLEDGFGFEQYYSNNCFRQHSGELSPFELCSLARNSMVSMHVESMNKLSNESTCLLLKQNLERYSRIVEDDSSPGSVNNFYKPMESVIHGKIQTDHCSSWKTNLRSSQIDPIALLKSSITIDGDCNSNDLNCDQSSVSDENVGKFLKKKPFNPLNQNFEVKNKEKVVPVLLNTKETLSRIKNNSFQYKNPSLSSIPNGKDTNDINKLENTPKPFSLKKQSDNNLGSFSNPMTSTKKMSKINIPSTDETKEFEPARFFTTARQELSIQNKKKYGNANHNQQNLQEAPVQKRSLGTARSVQSKFIPPVANNEKMEIDKNDSVVDDRLKNIDPKMIELIQNEIIDFGSPICWDDIAGLKFAKTAIQEAVVWPLLRPDIFTGLRRPPKGILLFGPPGTGKTLIGKCIASQCSATFFSISASSLTSKWIGEGEKMVRALFAVARCHQPAVVFVDEIDSLLTQRSDSEHEGTRRIKTEFLVQLDGAGTGDEDRLLFIGATNRPQELDEAARRRLVKRLYIPLPDLDARQEIVVRLMSTEKHSLDDGDVVNIATLADGFSGADMRCLCAEAALGPIRSVPFKEISNIQSDQVRPINIDDFKQALTRVRPSVSSDDLEHYVKWDLTYGSGNNSM